MSYRSTGWDGFFGLQGESRTSPTVSSVSCCQQAIAFIEADNICVFRVIGRQSGA